MTMCLAVLLAQVGTSVVNLTMRATEARLHASVCNQPGRAQAGQANAARLAGHSAKANRWRPPWRATRKPIMSRLARLKNTPTPNAGA